ncbi:MAG TPA: metallophosphoesterase [Longimicrobium sp.]|jgi:DNA repair exonuclease SbcCD nuclease subunit
MRIRILSDLHTEFAPFDPPPAGADVVVLAGDVALGLRGLDWARAAFGGMPVVYVAGNHEFYRHAVPKLTEDLAREAAGSSIHFLENAEVVVSGVRFLGCTLWTDFDLFDERIRSAAAAQASMNDFRLIRLSPRFRRFGPGDARTIHLRSVRWLRERLSAPFAGPTVVVTHHAPSIRSCAPSRRSDTLNAAYASDLEWMMDGSADLWIHGHTHHCVDYQIGATRIVSNQRGYPDEHVADFDPTMALELDVMRRKPSPSAIDTDR